MSTRPPEAARPAGRVWSLRSHLSALLIATMLVSFGGICATVVLWRVPEIEHFTRATLARDADDLSTRLELLLGERQSRLELLARLLHGRTPEQAGAVLGGAVRNSRLFDAVFLLSPQGRVLSAGVAPTERMRTEDLVGSDMSANALFRAAQDPGQLVWSGKYLSALSGRPTVGVADRDDRGQVLIGELPLTAVTRAVQAAVGQQDAMVWVVDRSGEVIADSEGGRYVGRLNLLTWPVLQALQRGEPPPEAFVFDGQRYHAAAMHAKALDWFVVAGTPAGWANDRVTRMLVSVAVIFGGSLVASLLLAPFWAQRMVRPLQDIVARAGQTTVGITDDRPWPWGPVREFNRLSEDLQTMAVKLREREQQLQGLFNAAPVSMAVVDVDNGSALLDVNEVWCRTMLRQREDVLGRTAVEFGLWTAEQRQRMLDSVQGDRLFGEAEMRRGDGQPVLMQVFGHYLVLPTRRLLIWAFVDIGPTRRIEQELRELNQDLETRVQQRTEALAASNAELSQALEQLQLTQAGLVQAEKMAALGALVAGVAHELNTPLGNSVMAVSAMADATRRLKAAMQSGLRRADLQAWLDSVEQGTDITGRNLRRAAELVQNFKQVAVDQTSAQRRRFELHEVVHEMVVSLRPSFARTPYRIEVEVPAKGLAMDSYPGALGQTVGNLIQNAVLHGFDGRGHGTVRISAEPADGDGIVLRVADDGKGIPAADLTRIFDPFMTTKMGRGGTGLGLHISFNAVVHVLGGTITAHSEPGGGACFELRLPRTAPHAAPAQQQRTSEARGAARSQASPA